MTESARNATWPLAVACVLGIVVAVWHLNLSAWPWHRIFEWAGGLSALVVAGVIVKSLLRERAENPVSGDDNLLMFAAILATTILTVSTLLNFVFFVIF